MLGCLAFRDQLYLLSGAQHVIVRSGGQWRLLPPDEWLGATPYNSHVNASGRLWFVTAPKGVRYTDDGATWGQINLPAPLLGGPLWSDGAGTLWLSTLGKVPAGSPLWRYKHGAWEPIPLPTSRTAVVFGIAGERSGAIWVRTSLGLYRWSGGSWQRIRVVPTGAPDGLPGAAVAGPWVDAAERVWVFTERGLAVYTDERWRVVALLREDGSEEVVSVSQVGILPRWAQLDPEGLLWTVSDDGLIGYLDTREPLRLI